MSVGARSGFGVFVVPMEEDFGWSRSAISAAIAVGWLINGISTPFLGRVFDRYGGRRIIPISLFILGTSTMLLSLTNSLWYLIVVYGFMMSIASSGASMVTINAVISRWFHKKRGLALSISTAGGSAGALVLAPFATYLILLGGWRITWFALGSFIVFLALPIALLVFRDNPSDVGEAPDGATDEKQPERSASEPTTMRGPLEVDEWTQSFRSPPMWQMTGAYFVCGMTTAMIAAHYVPFAIDRGFSPETAALAFGLMMGLNVIGALGAGTLSDKFGRKNLLVLVYAGRGLAYMMLLLAPGALGLWGFAVIAGLSWVASAVLTSSMIADIYGLKNLGTLDGMANFVHQMGGALSILMGGLMYDWLGSYTVPFGIAGSMLLVASIAAFSIREKRYSTKFQHLRANSVPITTGDGD